MNERTCTNCGSPFVGRSIQVYCTAACRERAKYAARKADGRYASQKASKRAAYQPTVRAIRPRLTCNETGCDRNRHEYGLCKMHAKRRRTALGLNTVKPWTDRQRSNHNARRARKLGTQGDERTTLTMVIARDGTLCTSCGIEVDLTLAYPHRYSKSFDHTVPLSKGGTHTMDNATLMHLTCNLSKGSKVA